MNALAANTEGSRAPLEGAGDTTTALALEPASEAAAQLGRQRGPGQDAAAITGTVTPAPTLVEQIVGSIQTFANRAGQGVRLRLVPEHLGEIDVKVTHRGDAITVEMFAQNATTRQAIESSLPLLRAALGEQGVQVDQFVVSGGGAFDPSGGGSTTSSWSENQPGIVPRGWANDMAGQQDGDQELPAAPERRLVDLRA